MRTKFSFNKFRILIYIILLFSFVALLFSIGKSFNEEETDMLGHEDIMNDIRNLKDSLNVPVLLYENNNNNVISINVIFKGGASLDLLGTEGISEMLAKTMIEATDDLNSAQFAELLNNYSIKLNAYASRDSIVFSMSTLVKNKTEAFEILNKVLLQNRFNQTNLDVVRNKMLTNLIASVNTPDYLIGKTIRTELFGNSVSASRNIYGSVESLKRINVANLRSFKNSVITRDNVYISISGNIDENDSVFYLQDLIQQLPVASNKELFDLRKVNANIPNYKEITIEMPNIVQSDIAIIMQAPIDILGNNQFANILNIYLGGSAESLLFKKLRNDEGLVYTVSSFIVESKVSTFWYFKMSTPLEKSDEAIQTTVDLLRSLKKEYVYKDVLLGKNLLLNVELKNYLNNASIAYYMNQLQFKEIPIADYIENLRSIKYLEKSQMDDLISTLDLDNILVVKTVLK